MSMRTAIALGSNLGDRLENLQAARNRLRQIAVAGEPILQASVYQTAPVNCPEDSPDFLNTVIELAFEGAPEDLLAATQAIETKLGRRRDGTPNAARTLDLDLLYLGEQVIHTEGLDLPHPRIAQRRFVLEPLAEISPRRVLPGQTQAVEELLAALPQDNEPLKVFVQEW